MPRQTFSSQTRQCSLNMGTHHNKSRVIGWIFGRKQSRVISPKLVLFEVYWTYLGTVLNWVATEQYKCSEAVSTSSTTITKEECPTCKQCAYYTLFGATHRQRSSSAAARFSLRHLRRCRGSLWDSSKEAVKRIDTRSTGRTTLNNGASGSRKRRSTGQLLTT